MLSEQQLERYHRHVILEEIGGARQEKILRARVLVIGAGGLGSPALFHLAAAGVGTLGIVDSDRVELSNLQRQIIHFTADIGREKAASARDKITALNPEVKVKPYPVLLEADNAREIIREYDFVIDGTDNFPAKFLVNDACVTEQKPFSHAGIMKFSGQAMTWRPGTACYRCVFRKPPPPDTVPGCRQAGVLGVVPGLLGTIQAAEALRFIIGRGRLLTNRLLTVDALNMEFREVKVRPATNCPACGRQKP